MKKRLIIAMVVLTVLVATFGYITTGFAIDRTHSDSVASNGLSATAKMKPIACCGASHVDVAKVKVRGQSRPILEPNSPLSYVYGNLRTWAGTTEMSSTVSVNENNVIVNSSHLCYAHCDVCTDRVGSTAAYH